MVERGRVRHDEGRIPTRRHDHCHDDGTAIAWYGNVYFLGYNGSSYAGLYRLEGLREGTNNNVVHCCHCFRGRQDERTALSSAAEAAA